MTPLERVLNAFSFKEGDRVPFFLPLTTLGAREAQMPIMEYFRSPSSIAETQLRMQERFGHDLLYSATYASNHYEAFGGDLITYEDSAPGSGAPIIHDWRDIASLKAPRVADCRCFQSDLEAIRLMRARVGTDIPILGFAVGPASLPIQQMGFESYLHLMHEAPELWRQLLAVNEELIREWIAAQVEAGIGVLGFYDPFASPTIAPPELWRQHVMAQTRSIIADAGVPCLLGYAAGRAQPPEDALATGAVAVTVSRQEDLRAAKQALHGRMTVAGNLDAIRMRHWTPAEAEAAVKKAIAEGGSGGGFLLCDHQGDIPWVVPDEVLTAIAAAVKRWGRYPLDWIESESPA